MGMKNVQYGDENDIGKNYLVGRRNEPTHSHKSW
jgi:hypothetical protein